VENAARTYSAALSDLEVKLEGGKLTVQARSKGGFPKSDVRPPNNQPPPFQIDFVEADRFAISEQPLRQAVGEFLRDRNGAIEWMHWGGRIHARKKSS